MSALRTSLVILCTLLIIGTLILLAEMSFAKRSGGEAQSDFARQVDLSALGKAAVHTSGRIQALDSYTAAVMEHITGPHRIDGASRTITFIDLILNSRAYFDTPIIYVHKKPVRERLVTGVLALQSDETSATDTTWIESFMDTGLISPSHLQHPAVAGEIEKMRRDLIRTAKFVNEIDFAMFRMQPRNLMNGLRIIPPIAGDETAAWFTPDDVEQLAKAGRSPFDEETTQAILGAWNRLVRGWVDADPNAVTLAANDLAEVAAAINPALYPNDKRSGWPWAFGAGASVVSWLTSFVLIAVCLGMFAFGIARSNRPLAKLGGWLAATLIVLQVGTLLLGGFHPLALESFYFAHYVRVNEIWMLYLLSVAVLLMAIVYRWDWARAAGLTMFAVAFALHSAALLLRWYVADRWPNSNIFEAVTTAAWFGGCGALVLETLVRRTGMRNLFALGSAAASMTAFMAAHFLPQYLNANISNMMPVLNDVWLYIHVNVIIFSYVLIFMAFIVALMYLCYRFVLLITGQDGTSQFARIGGAGSLMGIPSKTPGLKAHGSHSVGGMNSTSIGQVFDGATMVLVELSFILLWTGLVMGAIWADHSWGRPWGWDPKEVFALNTFLVFLVLIHVRIKTKDKGLWTSLLTIASCGVMLFNWIFINFKISGLHSYA